MINSIDAIVKKENRTTYIDIPIDITQRYNKKGRIKVRGKINEIYPYNKSLLPKGKGKYILTLNKSDLKNMNINIDDSINITIELDIQIKETNEDDNNIIPYYESYKKKINSNESITVLETIFTRRSVRKFTGQITKRSQYKLFCW